MPVHHRKHKIIQFVLDAVNFECQISNWNLDSGDQDGERHFTLCPDGEFIEDAEPEPTVSITFFADWRSGGLSDFLWTNRGQVAAMTIVHHPDIAGETVEFSGDVRLKAPPVGGEARTTETQEIEMQVVLLNYARQV